MTQEDGGPVSASASGPRIEPSILVVDSEPELVRVLTAGLQAQGYGVRSAATGAAALDAAFGDEPDVILLELGLPDLDGIDVCRHLRRNVRIPIIVLSADGAEARKIAALDEGADDYLSKPFSMPELLARIRVALRHRQERLAVLDGGTIEVGDLVIDVDAYQVQVAGQLLDLTRKELALLSVLARSAGKVLTHRRLLDQVWGPHQGLNTLRIHVAQLRRKLSPHTGAPHLMTEPGVGYRLISVDNEAHPKKD